MKKKFIYNEKRIFFGQENFVGLLPKYIARGAVVLQSQYTCCIVTVDRQQAGRWACWRWACWRWARRQGARGVPAERAGRARQAGMGGAHRARRRHGRWAARAAWALGRWVARAQARGRATAGAAAGRASVCGRADGRGRAAGPADGRQRRAGSVGRAQQGRQARGLGAGLARTVHSVHPT